MPKLSISADPGLLKGDWGGAVGKEDIFIFPTDKKKGDSFYTPLATAREGVSAVQGVGVEPPELLRTPPLRIRPCVHVRWHILIK